MDCVVQWFKNKKNCPQCRHSANERNLRKIFLAEVDGEATEENADSIQIKLDSAQMTSNDIAKLRPSPSQIGLSGLNLI